MTSPRFLTVAEVLTIHEHQIARYGGSAGLRDPGLLDSAVAQPQASFGGEYLHDGLFDMAAAYLFHIVMNHPFIDGNKRTALTAALTFLFLNGVRVRVDQDTLANFVLEVVTGSLEKPAIARFLSEHSAE